MGVTGATLSLWIVEDKINIVLFVSIDSFKLTFKWLDSQHEMFLKKTHSFRALGIFTWLDLSCNKKVSKWRYSIQSLWQGTRISMACFQHLSNVLAKAKYFHPILWRCWSRNQQNNNALLAYDASGRSKLW